MMLFILGYSMVVVGNAIRLMYKVEDAPADQAKQLSIAPKGVVVFSIIVMSVLWPLTWLLVGAMTAGRWVRK